MRILVIEDEPKAARYLERGLGESGFVVMLRAGTGTLLLTLTTREAKLGLVFLDMDRAADEIRKVL